MKQYEFDTKELYAAFMLLGATYALVDIWDPEHPKASTHKAIITWGAKIDQDAEHEDFTLAWSKFSDTFEKVVAHDLLGI